MNHDAIHSLSHSLSSAVARCQKEFNNVTDEEILWAIKILGAEVEIHYEKKAVKELNDLEKQIEDLEDDNNDNGDTVDE